MLQRESFAVVFMEPGNGWRFSFNVLQKCMFARYVGLVMVSTFLPANTLFVRDSICFSVTSLMKRLGPPLIWRLTTMAHYEITNWAKWNGVTTVSRNFNFDPHSIPKRFPQPFSCKRITLRRPCRYLLIHLSLVYIRVYWEGALSPSVGTITLWTKVPFATPHL